MSISTALQDAQNRVAAAYTKISEKGGTVPSEANLTNMPAAIDTISAGGGDEVVTVAVSTAKDFVEGDKVFLNKTDEVFNDSVIVSPSSGTTKDPFSSSGYNYQRAGYVDSARLNSVMYGSTAPYTGTAIYARGNRAGSGSAYTTVYTQASRTENNGWGMTWMTRVGPNKYLCAGYGVSSASSYIDYYAGFMENGVFSRFSYVSIVDNVQPRATVDGRVFTWGYSSGSVFRIKSDGSLETAYGTLSSVKSGGAIIPCYSVDGTCLLLSYERVSKWPEGGTPVSTGKIYGLPSGHFALYCLSSDGTYLLDAETGLIHHCENNSTGDRYYSVYLSDKDLTASAAKSGRYTFSVQYFNGDFYIFNQQNWWKFNNGTLTRLQNVFSDADFDIEEGDSVFTREVFVNFDENIALLVLKCINTSDVGVLRTAVKQLSVAPYEYASYDPDNFPIFDSTLTGYVKENQGVDSLGNTKLLVQTVLDPQHQPWSPEGKVLGFGTQITAGSPEEPEAAWTRPNLTSYGSYGVTSDTRNSPTDSESFWHAFDGSLSTNFVPSTRGSATFGKWVLPVTLRFKPSSVITWVHRNSSDTFGSSVQCQFFADEAMTKPLGSTFIDPSSSNAEVEIPCSNLTGNLDTDTIYLHIPAGGGWGGAAEIKFTGVYTSKALVEGSVSVAKGYYQDSTGTLIGSAQTATLTTLKDSQTAGYKNDLYMIGSTGTNAVPRVCKVDTAVNKGSLTTALKLSTPVYLSLAKNYILPGPTEGLDVTFEAQRTEAVENFTRVGTGVSYLDTGWTGGFTTSSYMQIPAGNIPAPTTKLDFISLMRTPATDASTGNYPFTFSISTSNTVWGFDATNQYFNGFMSGSSMTLVETVNELATTYWTRLVVTSSSVDLYVLKDMDDSGLNTYTIDTVPMDLSSWTKVATRSANILSSFTSSTIYTLGCNSRQSYSTAFWAIDRFNTRVIVDDTKVFNLISPVTNGSITVGAGYGYKDEQIGYYTVDSAITETPSELVVTGEMLYPEVAVENFTKVGAPVISADFNASGFTLTDYIKTPAGLFATTSEDWEYRTAFTLAGYTTEGALLDSATSGSYQMRLTVTSEGKPHFRTFSSASSFSFTVQLTGDYTFALNTLYGLKMNYTASTGTYTMYVSTNLDEDEWTEVGSATGDAVLASSTGDFSIGTNLGGNVVLDGSIDLARTYLNNGGTEWRPLGWNCEGYLYLTRSAEVSPKIISKISPIKNPTMQDLGGTMDPYDLKKTVTLTQDLTGILNVTDTQEDS